jgi:hypothetical protein
MLAVRSKCSSDSSTKLDGDDHVDGNLVLLHHDKGSTECIDKEELKRLLFSARKVYRWIPFHANEPTIGEADETYPVYKLPFTGKWVDSSITALDTGNYRVVPLKRMLIGSDIDSSSLHGADEQIYTIVKQKSVANLTKKDLEAMIKTGGIHLDDKIFASAAKRLARKDPTHFVEMAAQLENIPALVALLKNGHSPTVAVIDYIGELANADDDKALLVSNLVPGEIMTNRIIGLKDADNPTWDKLLESRGRKPVQQLSDKKLISLASKTDQKSIDRIKQQKEIPIIVLAVAIASDNNVLVDHLIGKLRFSMWKALESALENNITMPLDKISKVGVRYYKKR